MVHARTHLSTRKDNKKKSYIIHFLTITDYRGKNNCKMIVFAKNLLSLHRCLIMNYAL